MFLWTSQNKFSLNFFSKEKERRNIRRLLSVARTIAQRTRYGFNWSSNNEALEHRSVPEVRAHDLLLVVSIGEASSFNDSFCPTFQMLFSTIFDLQLTTLWSGLSERKLKTLLTDRNTPRSQQADRGSG